MDPFLNYIHASWIFQALLVLDNDFWVWKFQHGWQITTHSETSNCNIPAVPVFPHATSQCSGFWRRNPVQLEARGWGETGSRTGTCCHTSQPHEQNTIANLSHLKPVCSNHFQLRIRLRLLQWSQWQHRVDQFWGSPWVKMHQAVIQIQPVLSQPAKQLAQRLRIPPLCHHQALRPRNCLPQRQQPLRHALFLVVLLRRWPGRSWGRGSHWSKLKCLILMRLELNSTTYCVIYFMYPSLYMLFDYFVCMICISDLMAPFWEPIPHMI